MDTPGSRRKERYLAPECRREPLKRRLLAGSAVKEWWPGVPAGAGTVGRDRDLSCTPFVLETPAFL